ncbi:Glucose-induced degradation protein 8 homolog [Babesia microti strain RI]|uniref:Glucose-induced degradation protein 8 homolog n=1 Tax=Babesia microti (strain RI) TaxID=1133968 RepID=I7I8K4_BABMR|nr:Glucose-induced degradation protein 8 homolog [Babesia microti strain RI]CCF73253.1 Glucose-induced degradation protein 8 homolog [Babesia microti strain RI]|eukprot:XP_012647862.1 Glucose-induced degradation protein 8 homolog [Babesia microti strain RI]
MTETSDSSKSTFDINVWSKAVQGINVSDDELQAVVENYLICNALEETLVCFRKESHLDTTIDMPPINFRKKITEAILSGDVTHAIELIDELDPEILQINYEITFLLKQHHLIHLIQKNNALESLNFAKTELVPCIKDNVSLEANLEEALSLLVFSDKTCPEAQQLIRELDRKQDTAERVDQMLLKHYKVDSKPLLTSIIQEMKKTQGSLTGKLAVDVPTLEQLSRGGFLTG